MFVFGPGAVADQTKAAEHSKRTNMIMHLRLGRWATTESSDRFACSASAAPPPGFFPAAKIPIPLRRHVHSVMSEAINWGLLLLAVGSTVQAKISAGQNSGFETRKARRSYC